MKAKIKNGFLALTLISFISCSANDNATIDASTDKAAVPSKQESIQEKSKTKVMVKTGAYLEITLKINPENREKGAGVYLKYKEPFLSKIDGCHLKRIAAPWR